eukprot:TRINITY_DN201_c0_g1_i2.p1 TRINITY_DN201_c0_g1~~TRINITY_DN201_c0_g1_i2.p1  ORF type:complete len:239 (-),score=29.12 TRINITY_DN201_c0_g1_i2:283-999(-)
MITEMIIPKSRKEALGSQEAKHWEKAMIKEMNQFKEHMVYEEIPMPQREEIDKSEIIPGRWVFAIKDNGNVKDYKARYVLKGCRQKPYKHYDPDMLYAPGTRIQNVRLIIQFGVSLQHSFATWDVTAAYLKAEIEPRSTPLICYIEDADGKRPVKVLKSWYGLRQSGHNWCKKVTKAMTDHNFKPLAPEDGIYFRQTKYGPIFVIVHVDDFLMAAPKKYIKDFSHYLRRKWKVKPYIG